MGGVIAKKSGDNARYYRRVLLDIAGTFSGKIDLVVRGCDNCVQITQLIKKSGDF